MLKRSAFLLLGLCSAVPVHAGLFADDDARKQIQQVGARVLTLENRVVALENRLLKSEDALGQQTKSMLDLQGQIEALNGEIRKLRGQNEEVAHGLQEAEKRQKDFYVDLDTRLRHFETTEESAKEVNKGAAPASAVAPAAAVPANASDPASANRAFEAAYGLFKDGSHVEAVKAFHEFLKKYPDSVHVPNANYWLGNAKLVLKDYNGALNVYQDLLKDFPAMPNAAEIKFKIAECQLGLKQGPAAKQTLKQLIAQHPASEAATKAKKLLATIK